MRSTRASEGQHTAWGLSHPQKRRGRKFEGHGTLRSVKHNGQKVRTGGKGRWSGPISRILSRLDLPNGGDHLSGTRVAPSF